MKQKSFLRPEEKTERKAINLSGRILDIRPYRFEDGGVYRIHWNRFQDVKLRIIRILSGRTARIAALSSGLQGSIGV